TIVQRSAQRLCEHSHTDLCDRDLGGLGGVARGVDDMQLSVVAGVDHALADMACLRSSQRGATRADEQTAIIGHRLSLLGSRPESGPGRSSGTRPARWILDFLAVFASSAAHCP